MTRRNNVVAVIDDDPSVLEAMERLLSALGYDTELYASFEEFLRAAPSTAASYLLVDIHLGDSNGIELLRGLRSSGFNIPTIFMTGSDDPEVQRHAHEAGCLAFLRKPFSADLLREALNADDRT